MGGRAVILTMLTMGCVNPDPLWERRSGQTLELVIETEDPDADGLFVEQDFPFQEPDDRVRVELWQEQRLSERFEREVWMRLQVRQLAIGGIDCSDTARLTMWWDNTDWVYGLRIDDLQGEAPIEVEVENTGSQVDRFGFIRGTFDVQHPCVADGQTVGHTVSATWNLSEVDRDLESPPPGQRR